MSEINKVLSSSNPLYKSEQTLALGNPQRTYSFREELLRLSQRVDFLEGGATITSAPSPSPSPSSSPSPSVVPTPSVFCPKIVKWTKHEHMGATIVYGYSEQEDCWKLGPAGWILCKPQRRLPSEINISHQEAISLNEKIADTHPLPPFTTPNDPYPHWYCQDRCIARIISANNDGQFWHSGGTLAPLKVGDSVVRNWDRISHEKAIDIQAAISRPYPIERAYPIFALSKDTVYRWDDESICFVFYKGGWQPSFAEKQDMERILTFQEALDKEPLIAVTYQMPNTPSEHKSKYNNAMLKHTANARAEEAIPLRPTDTNQFSLHYGVDQLAPIRIHACSVPSSKVREWLADHLVAFAQRHIEDIVDSERDWRDRYKKARAELAAANKYIGELKAQLKPYSKEG